MVKTVCAKSWLQTNWMFHYAKDYWRTASEVWCYIGQKLEPLDIGCKLTGKLWNVNWSGPGAEHEVDRFEKWDGIGKDREKIY